MTTTPATVLVRSLSVVLGLRPGDVAEVSYEDYQNYLNDLEPIEQDPFAAPVIEAADNPELPAAADKKPAKPKTGDTPT